MITALAVASVMFAGGFSETTVTNIGGGELRVTTRYTDGSYGSLQLYHGIKSGNCPVWKSNGAGANLGDCGGGRTTYSDATGKISFRVYASSGDRIRVWRANRYFDCIYRPN